MKYSLNALYRAVGLSKQAVHQAKARQQAFDRELTQLELLAQEQRRRHPGCGLEKLYKTLAPQLMGRDRFCEVFKQLGYGLRRPKSVFKTTYPGHLRYPNLIEGMQLSRPHQLLQSDLTYFMAGQQTYYLVFVVDVYTRMILGYAAHDHMRTEANLKALRAALRKMNYPPWGSIHHSDRGVQYTSKAYRSCLKDHQIHLSMGSVAWENAYAERVNGIIKNEYLDYWNISSLSSLRRRLSQAVQHYNQHRLHRAFKLQFSPMNYYKNWLDLKETDRHLMRIYAHEMPSAEHSVATNSHRPLTLAPYCTL